MLARMNILFISLMDCSNLNGRGIYIDLLRAIRNKGHVVHVVSPVERGNAISEDKCNVIHDGETRIVKPIIGNIKRTKTIEKGITTITLGSILRRAIRKYLSDVKFDLVLYPTPPITFLEAVEYVKRRDNAKTYLMLKDIFPQNAVDVGMLSIQGPKRALLNYFRRQERKLYAISDYIGCMSQANVDYLIAHNPTLDTRHVGLCPNSVEPVEMSCNKATRNALREKYDIPIDKTVFIYGGSLGRPQGIPFLIECLNEQVANKDAYFLVVGRGTEYGKIESFFAERKPGNAKLMKFLPKDDYDKLVGSCDVGLIFLDSRFTIPNFPSRLLSYMQAKLPVICATDDVTDVGRVAEEGGFGIACSSANVKSFNEAVDVMLNSELKPMGELGWNYLLTHFDVKDTASSITMTAKEL